jgi:hypothetical protein
MDWILQIEESLEPQRDILKNHRLYSSITDLDSIHVFMENHVYAVWDFMSLLKSLQNNLTTVSIPWVPAKDGTLAWFINEIVVAEESDVNENGERKSHFEMYLDSMSELGANTSGIEAFIKNVQSGSPIDLILRNTSLDERIKDFVNFTFQTIASGKSHQIAAAFTFGREDLIPDIFIEVLKQSENLRFSTSSFRYYLDRHIELDGDEHGPLAIEMIKELCHNSEEKYKEVLHISKQALMHRIKLWDAIAEAILDSSIQRKLVG